MNLLFVMDPVEVLDPAGDTTIALMEAAHALGHQLWVTEMRLLEAAPGPQAVARRIDVSPWFRADPPERVELEAMEAIFIRTDPPFDSLYLWGMHILDLVGRGRTLLVNDPAGIRAANEKLFALRFPDLIPPTLVTSEAAAIRRFVDENGPAVVKPIDGHAGRGVLRLEPADPNLPSIAELMTGRGQRQVVVQRFVDAAAGNRRIFMVDGEPVASVNRRPVDRDFRTGDVVEVVELSAAERCLCERIAPALVRHGLRFAGLDVIAGRLIEVNVTSPGGLRQLERLSGRGYAASIVNRLLSIPSHALEVLP